MKQARHKKTNTVGFHLHEVPNVVKFRDRTENGGGQELGRGSGELLFNGDRGQLEKMERVLETDVLTVTQREWASCQTACLVVKFRLRVSPW